MYQIRPETEQKKWFTAFMGKKEKCDNYLLSQVEDSSDLMEISIFYFVRKIKWCQQR